MEHRSQVCVIIVLPVQEAAKITSSAASDELSVVEGQLTWLVHIIGAIIKGRQSSNSGYDPSLEVS